MKSKSATLEPTHRQVLSVAVPIMLSNISTPLIGIVDTGVIGRLGEAAAIGAVAIGAMMFTIVFWAFGFLRMGTSGLTAQAVGQRNHPERDAALARSLLVAIGLGIALIALHWPIRELALLIIDGSRQVETLAARYFDIRIWAAPATLVNYALVGWFVGRARAGTALALQLLLNSVNIALDALLVLVFDWGIAGIASGTVCAEIVAAVVGLAVAIRQMDRFPSASEIFDAVRLRRLFDVSSNIMVRTLALMFVFAWFTTTGAAFGDVVLATNAILMHMISTSAYFLDGLAHATETFVGHSIGERNLGKLRIAIRRTSFWALLIATINALLIWIIGDAFVGLLTSSPEVREVAARHLPWVVAAPLAGVTCFQLDGVFIGATRTREMRNAMLASTAVFVFAWWLLQPWGNHGLWAALFVHYGARTVSLLYYIRTIAVLRSRP